MWHSVVVSVLNISNEEKIEYDGSNRLWHGKCNGMICIRLKSSLSNAATHKHTYSGHNITVSYVTYNTEYQEPEP